MKENGKGIPCGNDRKKGNDVCGVGKWWEVTLYTGVEGTSLELL
jgi:hypothetical protein